MNTFHSSAQTAQIVCTIRSLVTELHSRGLDYSAIENGIHTYPVSYRLVIQGRGRIFFPDYKAKAYLNPVERTLFYLFLNHPEGIASDDLVLHWKELCHIYSRESSFADSEFREDKIESLCAESKTVFYATVSRIKRKFCDAVGNLNAESFIIKKEKGGKYRIRSNIILMKRI